jgi:hypothetical protein
MIEQIQNIDVKKEKRTSSCNGRNFSNICHIEWKNKTKKNASILSRSFSAEKCYFPLLTAVVKLLKGTSMRF